MKIENWDINKLKPYDHNPRKNDDAVDAVAESLEKFGFRQPIVVDEHGVVIVGHTRLKAAQKLGLKEVPVHVADLDPVSAKAYRLADNQTATLAEWDFPALEIELKELKELDFDVSGFDFDANFSGGPVGGGAEQDSVPDENTVESITKIGDIWVMGKHRLLCGDSTKIEDVSRLMDGQLADMVFTDPPYGVAVNTGDKKDLEARNRRTDGLKIKNDDLTAQELTKFLDSVFKNYYKHLKPGGVLYICHAEGLGMDVVFRSAFSNAGFKSSEIIIWCKDQFAFGRQDYHWRHEPIIYGWKEGASHYFIDDRTQDTVWNIPRPKKSELHPTMKPVELVEKAVKNSSLPGQIVMDTFVGSGTTIVACEKTGRICYGMELDPHYCDVIVKRWEDFTGNKAIRNG